MFEERVKRLLCNDEFYGNIKCSIIRGSIYELNVASISISDLFDGVPEDILKILNDKSYHHLIINSKKNRKRLVEALHHIAPEKADLHAFNMIDWLFLTDAYVFMNRKQFYEQIPYIHSIEDNFSYYQDVFEMIEGIHLLGDCFSKISIVESYEDFSEFSNQVLIMTSGLKYENKVNDFLRQNQKIVEERVIKDLEKEGWEVECLLSLRQVYKESDQMVNSSYAFIQPNFKDAENQFVLTLKNQQKDKEEWIALGCEGMIIDEVFTYKETEVTEEQKQIIKIFAKGAGMEISEDAFETGGGM